MDFGFSARSFSSCFWRSSSLGPRSTGTRPYLGKFMAEFKKASNEFQGQIHDEIRKLELEEVNPAKHLEPEIAKISSDEDLSIQGALNRLTERMKNTVAQDTDV